ncbi:MAG: RdgB/HAM1 family non-canonical purine NTP pyrophosphatase [Bacteroidota bacterium]
MQQILLATRNRHKVPELEGLLADLGVKVLSLEDFPGVPETPEDQPTLEGNALAKARAAFRHLRIPSLADDTGLEVHYLNDAPGVYSSRYAGEGATYSDNCRKLLGEMRGVPPRRRGARFRCVVAFVSAEMEKTAQGVLGGVILEAPRGMHGFGYDPIFLPSGSSRTLAEMTLHEKNALSHRARAMEQMAAYLRMEVLKRGH